MLAESPVLDFPTVSNGLLIFQCTCCALSISAPVEMIGETAECPYCHHHFSVAAPEPPAEVLAEPVPSSEEIHAEINNLQGQLRENVTQVTELRGNMSRLNMELHRHQIRLDNLMERQKGLNEGIDSAKARLPD